MALTADAIKAKAPAFGFDLCGIAPAEPFDALNRLTEWLARGHAAEMHWLERSITKRLDPREVLAGARSIVSCAVIYNTAEPYSATLPEGHASIARYAWGDDYHVVIERRLEAFEQWLREEAGGDCVTRRYVDTGPISEKAVAARAGLGWVGKNTCLINQQLGSWLFLGEILTTLPLDPDQPAADRCGTCTLCIDACPTAAITEPYQLDARKCLSYLTIEHRGDLPEAAQASIGSHVYGCDICQDVCPWNRRAAVSTDPAWQPREAWRPVPVAEMAARTDDELRSAMKGSAMKRAGVKGLRRNLDASLRHV
ncbi:MAG: tRNA epoxyqueuosine(34) reductase QueG [Acidobacteriota bacterium]|nr:tRNA epoxyqueuosine(34) reductase QueG [Acidobacteriota bacterium]